jgi:hypothetical protein
VRQRGEAAGAQVQSNGLFTPGSSANAPAWRPARRGSRAGEGADVAAAIARDLLWDSTGQMPWLDPTCGVTSPTFGGDVIAFPVLGAFATTIAGPPNSALLDGPA